MRQDLLKLIDAEKDVTNAIILTHNIDFIFLQSIVLPVMKRCGNPKLTIFADAQCATETYSRQAPIISGLGTRYRVVKVPMLSGFRFHPKAVLLSGEKRGSLWVGSGNLTFGGWRENAEIWRSFNSDKDGTGVFNAFYRYLKNILERILLKDPVLGEIEEAYDKGTRQWALDMDEPEHLVGRTGSESFSMLDEVENILGGRNIDEIVLCSPYFDNEGKALQLIGEKFKPHTVKVLAQNRKSGLWKSVAEELPSSYQIQPVIFNRKSQDDYPREAFIHAKFYALIHGEEVTVVAGSANCSNAALTIPGSSGNAELVVYETISKVEFDARYLSDIEFLEGEAVLEVREEEEEDEALHEPELIILAARYDNGLLSIAYKSNEFAEILACIIGGEKKTIETKQPGLIEIMLNDPPDRGVQLEYKLNKKVRLSPPVWVDQEEALSDTAKKRSLIQAIRKNVTKDSWTIGAWAELLSIFHENLQYNPKNYLGREAGRKKADQSDTLVEYSQDDIFSEGYGLPKPEQIFSDIKSSSSAYSLQQLLYRWLGYSDVDEEAEGEKGDEEDMTADDGDTDEDIQRDQIKAAKYLEKRKQEEKKLNEETEKEKERNKTKVKKLIDAIPAAMSNPEFLEKRPPSKLADDIKISVILLRSGLLEGWITEDEFFEFSHRVWIPLFFTSQKDPTKGWIEYRSSLGEEADFRKALESPAMTAALIAWTVTANRARASMEYNRFYLACVISAARIPWLWKGGSKEDIAKELVSLLRIGKQTKEAFDSTWEEAEKHLLSVIRRGEALRLAEMSLLKLNPGDVKDKIQQREVKAGELLWQGKDKGFCVSKEQFMRSDNKNIIVQSLQKIADCLFLSQYAIPLQALLKESIIDGNNGFETKHRIVMEKLATDFYNSFQHMNKRESVVP